jgi:lysophospholipid acyltransferase (LPLAT)-like uncharacterized protein
MDVSTQPGQSKSAGKLGTRLKIWVISELAYWTIRIVGSTLRWKVEGFDSFESHRASKGKSILVFWHGRIFPGTYFFRKMGIVVMTSRNRDGDYIARTILRFGYGVARGSSTRGGSRALVKMLHELKRNHDVAFTIDGPLGPRYVAKPGAVWLASKSGAAIYPFNISPEKKWVFRSWDHFQFPKPFTRVVLLMGDPIFVKPQATQEELDQSQQLLQRTLEDLLNRSDSYWLSPKI